MDSQVCRKLRPFGTTVFSEMSQLAREFGAINLSQGFPDFDGPPEVLAEAVSALERGENQYSRSLGHLELVEAVAEVTFRNYGLEYDPLEEVGTYAGTSITDAVSDLPRRPRPS